MLLLPHCSDIKLTPANATCLASCGKRANESLWQHTTLQACAQAWSGHLLTVDVCSAAHGTCKAQMRVIILKYHSAAGA